MTIAVKFKIFSTVNGALTRSVSDVTLDYADAASMPVYVTWNSRGWERQGNPASSTNFKPWDPPVFIDLERDNKVVEI